MTGISNTSAKVEVADEAGSAFTFDQFQAVLQFMSQNQPTGKIHYVSSLDILPDFSQVLAAAVPVRVVVNVRRQNAPLPDTPSSPSLPPVAASGSSSHAPPHLPTGPSVHGRSTHGSAPSDAPSSPYPTPSISLPIVSATITMLVPAQTPPPVAPIPVAPTLVAPTLVAPTPAAPTPAATDPLQVGPVDEKRFYAVVRGRRVGVFDDWNMTSPHVSGVPNASCRRYGTRQQAERAFATALNAGLVLIIPE
ncbi:hypothetical protein A0H81_05785 [Grifola frondosa]|uniref:Ribonuclease H1 N-terminal domain-containing protein n=1 Tax=Grifola frondosa TaxID=5627 RepID=A0A1C7MC94_GRIFR|nr:hypothetical protein A0H81_05785 [Grifola frondosa]